MPKIKNVFIWKSRIVDDYSAMRGPCSSGFHVMRNSDFTGLKSIMEGLGLTMNDWSGYLKIPLSGEYASGGSRYNLGDRWAFQSCNTASQYGVMIYGNTYPTGAISNRGAAFPIRPFKDEPIKPEPHETGWTGLYINGSNRDSGIAHNSSEGIISVWDSNGNCVTIADKNLGATVVYNGGDTESATNVGNYYQWGNCYGFPYGGGFATSSTQVDASAYGPGNYYSSSTFIRGAYSYWDTTINTNLWGGDTGVVQRTVKEEKEIYSGQIEQGQ